MKKNISLFLFGIAVTGVIITGCGRDKTQPNLEYAPNMYEALAYNPDQANPNFKDGKTAQMPVDGTIPVGFEVFNYPNTPEAYEKAGAELKSPLEKNEKNLADGKKLYVKMCSHCHGAEGKSDGAIVAAGKFPPPPAYQSEQLKNLPEGKMFFSITYGKNLMGSHASQLNKTERWKIVQYVQSLQQL